MQLSAGIGVLITRGPDIRAKGIVIVRQPTDRIYIRLAHMQMKIFRLIDQKWCHY